ncbi:TPA: hypothetical protein SFI03_000921 [Staphylococcus aureus]|uniref:hypothetical protein n=1 Tax=Staphylococcus aureus TaxID=1280 RepID=UPI0009305775|nr:hypothetical protein [Staphylococcus aureus]MCB4384240.1 hypothetical protein [Staphylococcus aureus]HEG7242432.1 hypothetical protein [Staphylococcus aureus]HEH8020872.1 hypothetical protein [Staphylococcus aureus]
MQVGGAPTQRISKRNSTDNASWRGPNTEADGKPAYNNVQVGERVPKKDDSKFIVVTTSSIMTPLLLL